MEIFRILGQIFFYAGIIGGFLLTIYYSTLLLKVSKEEGIDINDLIFVRREPSGKWRETVKKTKSYGRILFLLVGIGVLFIFVSFL